MLLAPLLISALTLLGGCDGNSTQEAGQSTSAGPPVPGGRGAMMGSGMGRHGMMMGSPMQRRRQAMMMGIPAAYSGLRNPLAASSEVLSAGAALYRANCAACHGETGEGNGPAAAGLSPPPADLRWLASRSMASDGYLMWAISEGGTALGTAMPAFNNTLSETERWQIIRYLQTLP